MANTARLSEKPKLRPAARCSITAAQPVCSHNRPKINGAPMRAVANVSQRSVLQAGDQHGGLGEPRAGAQQRIELARGFEVLDTAEGGKHALARGGAVAGVFHDLQVAAISGRFDAEEHAAHRWDTAFLARKSGDSLCQLRITAD